MPVPSGGTKAAALANAHALGDALVESSSGGGAGPGGAPTLRIADVAYTLRVGREVCRVLTIHVSRARPIFFATRRAARQAA